MTFTNAHHFSINGNNIDIVNEGVNNFTLIPTHSQSWSSAHLGKLDSIAPGCLSVPPNPNQGSRLEASATIYCVPSTPAMSSTNLSPTASTVGSSPPVNTIPPITSGSDSDTSSWRSLGDSPQENTIAIAPPNPADLEDSSAISLLLRADTTRYASPHSHSTFLELPPYASIVAAVSRALRLWGQHSTFLERISLRNANTFQTGKARVRLAPQSSRYWKPNRISDRTNVVHQGRSDAMPAHDYQSVPQSHVTQPLPSPSMVSQLSAPANQYLHHLILLPLLNFQTLVYVSPTRSGKRTGKRTRNRIHSDIIMKTRHSFQWKHTNNKKQAEIARANATARKNYKPTPSLHNTQAGTNAPHSSLKADFSVSTRAGRHI